MNLVIKTIIKHRRIGKIIFYKDRTRKNFDYNRFQANYAILLVI